MNFPQFVIAAIALRNLSVFHFSMQTHSGDLITRGTVWLALTLYVASELRGAVRRDRNRLSISWWLYTAGCVLFLGHVAVAFNYFYGWRHAVAYADIARQSKKLTGWDSGGGIYLNYFFGIVWVSEVLWARIAYGGYSSRPAFWMWAVRALFLFMIFNGAFVFVRSNMRWFGLVLCLLLMMSWRIGAKRSIDRRASAKSS